MQVGKGRRNLKGFVNVLMVTLILLQDFSYTLETNSDALALLSFKRSICSDPFFSLSNWNEWDQTPCNWSGILCLKVDNSSDDFRVVSLQLPQKRLAGSIPKELGKLTYLRNIELQNNLLIGMLHPEIFEASFVRNILLSGNQLSGIIPPEVGKLKDIRNLDLGSNRLVGRIPESITNCTSLVSLVLKENTLTGSIPYGIGSSLSSLQRLDFSSNRLTGSIPTDLGDLSSLQGTMNFSCNQLTGPIPTTLGKLPLNVSIDLQQNDLCGPIPQTGALLNQGPTAFLGNPCLCGFPMKMECPSLPSGPRNLPPGGRAQMKPPSTVLVLRAPKASKSLGRKQIVVIVMGDVFGIAIICVTFIYCYRRHVIRKAKGDVGSCPEKASIAKYDGCSLREGSEERSVDIELGELVHLGEELKFELDDLLKASAYAVGRSGTRMLYKAVLEGGVTVAVRSLGIEGDRNHKEINSQLQAMGRVCHPNVVHLKAYFWTAQEKLLVYDFKSGGNLATVLQARRTSKGPLSWPKQLNIAKGAAQGLAYLHECGNRKYVHGDVKPTKILLDGNMEACIADFQLAKLQSLCTAPPESTMEGLHLLRSSPYQPPEASKSLIPTQKWDVYAFGVILLELLTGKSLPTKLSSSELDLVAWVHTSTQASRSFSKVLDPLLLERMNVQHEMLEVLQIALSCVQIAPEQRPKMKQVAEFLGKIGC